jgi:spore coat polysaccharide biosynthesis protein SpsF
MTTAIVIQARSGSTRLPGKILKPVAGAPLLQRMLERVCAASSADEVIVATTQLPDDDAIVSVAAAAGVPYVRGHATDLLDRHVAAARAVDADVVVKIPSDCPLVDPETIDHVIDAFDAAPCDYLSNLHPASWPDGCDVEVMSRAALEVAWREATRPFEREHTTPYLWDNPERFVIRNVTCEPDRSRLYRLTLDYAEDYELIAGVYEQLWTPHRHFSLREIISLLASRPELRAVNARHLGTGWIDQHRSELKTLGARP